MTHTDYKGSILTGSSIDPDTLTGKEEFITGTLYDARVDRRHAFGFILNDKKKRFPDCTNIITSKIVEHYRGVKNELIVTANSVYLITSKMEEDKVD